MSDQVTALPNAAQHADPETPAATRQRGRAFEKIRALALGVSFPVLLVLLWHFAVVYTGTRSIPSPRQVAVMMYDFTFGGVYDDAFSATILTHTWKSMQRVYGGFFLAAVVAIPLGLMIGRIKVLRELLDPTINLLRPIPVTAWLPLSMIFFGLGPNAAIFLVFLGSVLSHPAQYDFRRAFSRREAVRGGRDAGLHGIGDVPPGRVSCVAAPRSSTGCGSHMVLPGSSSWSAR